MKSPWHEPPVVGTAHESSSDAPPAPVSGERLRPPDVGTAGTEPLAIVRAELGLRGVVAHAPVVLWAVDPSGVITQAEGGALGAMEPVAVGRSAFELYGRVRVVESGARTTTGDTLLRRALAGAACAGLAEIGDARYETKMVPVLGPGGEVTGVVGVAIDVTERVREGARLLQMDRLNAVGTLAAGVTHEIDHPLACLEKTVDLVLRLLRARADKWRSAEVVSGTTTADEVQELSAALAFVRDTTARMRRIVRDMTAFARSGNERRSLLDVRAILRPVVHIVSDELRRCARLVEDLRDVPLVYVNEERVGQVFMNLLLNAVQAIPGGDADRHEIGVSTYTDTAGRAVFEVRDTGPGIAAGIVGRIFEPFFTTKPGGLHPGLGLSICHGIVTALGGEISVRPAQSGSSAGSVFRVALPAAAIGAPA